METRATYNSLCVIVLVFTFVFLSMTDMFAQSISRQVIGITGGTFQFNAARVSWTAGETLIGKATSSDGQTAVTIGFQQPDLSILPPATDEKLLLNISPNPTPDLINVILLDPTNKDLRLTLSNAQGQVLVPALLLDPWKNEIDLSRFPAGVYFLNVTDLENSFQTYKIIKTE